MRIKHWIATPEGNAQALREMREAELTAGWRWIQPKNRQELLDRLRVATELAVPERERENLCNVARGEIIKLTAALQGIAAYGTDHNGCCPYGCDTPTIASMALAKGLE